MIKKVCIDSTNPKTRKCFSFNFNFDSKLSRDKIIFTMKEIMKDYNENYSIYISTKDFDEEQTPSEDIKNSLEILK